MNKIDKQFFTEALEELENIERGEFLTFEEVFGDGEYFMTKTSPKVNMAIIGWFNGLPIYGLESHLCMLLSEDVLRKEWNTPEEDKAWENL